MTEEPLSTDDEEGAIGLIVGSPEVTEAAFEAEPSPKASEAATAQIATDDGPDEIIRELGGKAFGEFFDGLGVEAGPTLTDLAGTFLADLSSLIPGAGSRVTRICAVGGLLALVAAPPILRVLGYLKPQGGLDVSYNPAEAE